MYSVHNWIQPVPGLDKSTCDKIRMLAEDKWTKSRIADGKSPAEEIVPKKNVRTSEIVWIQNQWVYDTIWSYMAEANIKAGWKYDIESAEDMQISRYKKGGFYNFHKDGKNDHLSVYTENNPIILGRVRKLSMTVLLNDDYDGGEFQFASYKKQKCVISTPEFNKTGSIIVFPSDMEHRVAPVTKGIRYSLVVWFLGPPFR